jgi:hypothetical protein
VPQEYWRRFKDMPLEQLATQPKLENLDQTRCALAMLENQDWNVGRLLKKLDDLKLAENTIVLYFSDNGPNGARWTGGMKGTKGGTDEGSVRSVCFLRWPGRVPKGVSIPEIAGAIDLLPTLTALAGVPHAGDKPLDGRDLSPLLSGQKTDWQARLLFTTWAGKVSVRDQQYRLDASGALFDLLADPGQTRDVEAAQPAAAARLRLAAEAWRAEVIGPDAEAMKERHGVVDPRKIGVGFPEFPITMLPARDGVPRGCIKRSSNAPNCSYFVNWADKTGEMVWEIDVQTAGEYDVSIDYTCPLADAGSLVELSLNGARLAGRVTPGWDPPLNTNQDTVPRPAGESQMKPFKPLALGTIHLEKGAGPLTLRALEIPEASVMDVRRVTLTLKK